MKTVRDIIDEIDEYKALRNATTDEESALYYTECIDCLLSRMVMPDPLGVD